MKNKIVEIIKDALIRILDLDKKKKIYPNTNLKEDLGLDSMSSLMFLMTLEESIDGFIVDPETLESHHLSTLDSITQYVMFQLSVK